MSIQKAKYRKVTKTKLSVNDCILVTNEDYRSVVFVQS